MGGHTDRNWTMIQDLAVLNEIPDGVNVVNQQYDLIFANRAIEEVYGRWKGRKFLERVGMTRS